MAAIPMILIARGTIAHSATAETKSKPSKVNSVTVQAFADREAIVPGESLTLAVSLKMDRNWHVYWRSPGGTGLPTDITWTAPEGFTVGDTRFPIPETHYDKVLKETSYIHEGTAVFLTPVTVPTTARPGTPARFEVEVNWLACKKNCIPGSATAVLDLPIAAPGTPVKPAHAKLFASAREALPAPGDKAEHIQLSGSIDRKTAGPGETFNAILNVEISPKHHMQSHTPLQKGLIPAVLFVAWTEDFEIGEVAYPKAHERTDPVLGKLSEYSGTIALKIPVEVDEEADKSPRRISGIFQYQICTDAGMCYPPRHVTFEIPVPMEGGPAPATGGQAGGAVETAAASVTGSTDTRVTEGHPAANEQKAQPGNETAAPAPGEDHRSILIRAQEWLFDLGFAGVMIGGFLGGLLLNIMPCVLPVISLKVLSFVRQAQEERWRIFLLGLTYSAGILVFYGILALLFFWKGQGWGEHFQNPVFVIVIGSFVLAFALSLFGVFVLFTPKVVNVLGEKVEGEGYLSAFSTGLLATVMGTACSAPFLSAAIGYASRVSPIQGTTIFLAAGIGMASPIILLTLKPDWLRFVPKPGPWMGVFEGIMGFILFGTVIWLINPLRDQIGAYGLLLSLIFLLSVAIAVWIKGKIGFGAPLNRKAKLYACMIAVLVLGWCLPFRVMATIPKLREEHNKHEALYARGLLDKYGKNLDWSDGIPWQPYVRDIALQDVRDGYTLFVDYTASWCASCKANLTAFISQPEVIQAMRELNIIPYEADYSNYVADIKADLTRFGRAGVPMYLVYKPGDPDNPELLPELLSKGVIIDALRRAGPSRIKVAKSD